MQIIATWYANYLYLFLALKGVGHRVITCNAKMIFVTHVNKTLNDPYSSAFRFLRIIPVGPQPCSKL